MKSLASGEAKTNFGRLLDMSQREPVTIEKHGRPVSVILSFEEFERYQMLEDKVWAMEAEKAAAGGYLSVADSENFLKSL